MSVNDGERQSGERGPMPPGRRWGRARPSRRAEGSRQDAIARRLSVASSAEMVGPSSASPHDVQASSGQSRPWPSSHGGRSKSRLLRHPAHHSRCSSAVIVDPLIHVVQLGHQARTDPRRNPVGTPQGVRGKAKLRCTIACGAAAASVRFRASPRGTYLVAQAAGPAARTKAEPRVRRLAGPTGVRRLGAGIQRVAAPNSEVKWIAS